MSTIPEGALPREAHREVRQELEAAGVVFDASPLEPESLWVKAKLPEGWAIVRHECSRTWSDLVDEDQQPRAAIFNKVGLMGHEAYITACSPTPQSTTHIERR